MYLIAARTLKFMRRTATSGVQSSVCSTFFHGFYEHIYFTASLAWSSLKNWFLLRSEYVIVNETSDESEGSSD